MTDPSNRLAVLGVLLATFIATPASADDPTPGAKGAEKAAEGKAKAAEARADKAADKAEKAADKAEKAEDKAEKAADKAEERADKAMGARGEFRSAVRQLHMDLREGKIKPAEIKDRLAKLREDAKDRRKAHQQVLKEQWGDALAKPNAREELRHHARRTAFLNRALLLAETEKKGKDKDKVIERIEKLIEKENTRHAAAMERIKSGQAVTSPAAAAATATGAKDTAPAKGASDKAPGDPASNPGKAGEK
jgi:colicin import membrane protein